MPRYRGTIFQFPGFLRFTNRVYVASYAAKKYATRLLTPSDTGLRED